MPWIAGLNVRGHVVPIQLEYTRGLEFGCPES